LRLTRRVLLLNIVPVVIAFIIAGVVYFISMAMIVTLSSSSREVESIEKTMQRHAVYAQLEIELSKLTVDELNASQIIDAITVHLKQVNSDFAIIDGQIIIASSIVLNRIDVNQILNSLTFQHEMIQISGINTEYKVIPLASKQAYLFIMHPFQKQLFSLWIPAIIAIVTFLIVFISISIYISRKITNEIIRPVERLKQAAAQISEGELDSVITEEGEGEVLELCKALEQMRIKLKESISLQQKYDSNRSFLVSSISHDLKTPVTSIKGYIEGILDGVANTPDKQKAYLLTAHRKTILIHTMIEDLLLYSKLDLRQLPFHMQPIDFAAYITDGVQEHYNLMQMKNLKLELQINELKERHVLLDGDRFMRVVQNIIDNAIHYNDKESPELTIMLRETYTSLVLEVKDNGIGINQEDTERIFDRFYRSDKARSVETGSGLGLAIVKQIVEEHKGEIWVKSSEGIGTSILISLPKVKGEIRK